MKCTRFLVVRFRLCEIKIICDDIAMCDLVHDVKTTFEPRCEKTGFLHMRS